MPFKDPEARRAYDRMRQQRDKEKRTARNVAYKRKRYAADPEYREKVKAASRATPPHVWRAHKAVRRAVLRGELVTPMFCENCASAGPLEAAHKDYDRPLDVRWLCRSCHRLWDKAQPKSRVMAGSSTESK